MRITYHDDGELIRISDLPKIREDPDIVQKNNDRAVAVAMGLGHRDIDVTLGYDPHSSAIIYRLECKLCGKVGLAKSYTHIGVSYFSGRLMHQSCLEMQLRLFEDEP